MVALLPLAVAVAVALFASLLIRELAPESAEAELGIALDYVIVALLAVALLALAELVGVVTL
jgi:hypothetical protein